MRLTTVLLIATIMQVSASGFAQKVTYQNKKASLLQVFKEIKIQTGFNVVWNADELKNARLINADFKNSSLAQVLKESLSGLPLTYTIDENTIIIKKPEAGILEISMIILKVSMWPEGYLMKLIDRCQVQRYVSRVLPSV